MKDSYKVAKWEIKTILRNKTFIIMTFFVPILMLIIGGIIGYISSKGLSEKDLSLGINIQNEVIQESIIKEKENENTKLKLFYDFDEKNIDKVIKENDLDGFIIIPENVFEVNKISYYFNDIGGIESDRIKKLISPVIVNNRIQNFGYDIDEINNLVQEVNIESISINNKESSNPIEMFLPFGFAMLMVFASIFSGATLMQSIIKEKSNRIVEIILSSISSWDLMLGKVIGYGILGLIQISIWSISAFVVLKIFFKVSLMSIFSIKVMYMFIFFILGFILISSINAIVGAGMKEAQSGSQSTGFLVMIPLIPLYFSGLIINNPEGTLSYIFSYIPFTSATAMLIRLGFSNPSFLEIISVIMILIISNYLLIKLAAKIFRVGMLMYGKNASFKELFKWAKSEDF